MPERWTGEIVALLHTNKIKQKEIAERMGVTSEYVCMILNGAKAPRDAEQRMRNAINAILAERNGAE